MFGKSVTEFSTEVSEKVAPLFPIKLMSRADRKSQVRKCLDFVQLIFGPCWPMNQPNKYPNIA